MAFVQMQPEYCEESGKLLEKVSRKILLKMPLLVDLKKKNDKMDVYGIRAADCLKAVPGGCFMLLDIRRQVFMKWGIVLSCLKS